MTTQRWEDARRLEAWAGEVRVNLIRAAALVAFYAHHLVNVYLIPHEAAVQSDLRGNFTILVTAVVLAWAGAIFVLYFCLSRRLVPPALKYVATAWDLAMITALLMIRDGPHSPLIFLYFLVIAAAPLRLSLPLVYVATLGAMGAATLMMGHYVFIEVGRENYYDLHKPYGVARTAEVIFLLSLGVAGLFAGQVVRQARRLVEGYPVRVNDTREAA
jgi:hypothetical protein